MKCVVLFLSITLGGCSLLGTLPQELDPKIYYKHDMLISVNGVEAEGVVVAAKAQKYEITITSQADMDMLQITSCQRDVTVENAIKGGWFKPHRGYKFTYEPTSVEREPGCLLKLAGYDKESGRHSWAFIEFQDDRFTLPAGVACNGATEYLSDGVSACQSLQGLIQLIWFKTKVLVSDKVLDRCKIAESYDGGVHWKFRQPNRECIFEFMEAKAPYRRHRLTTVGYESVPVRASD
jgi:hypothetical protein